MENQPINKPELEILGKIAELRELVKTLRKTTDPDEMEYLYSRMEQLSAEIIASK